jgi:hypothetical protein
MSRVMRVLLCAMFAIVLSGAATPSAFATEAPYYKVAGSRLGPGGSKEVEFRAEGNQVLKAPGAGITITCTGLAVKTTATFNGSAMGEPGVSAGSLEYSGCTVAGNGSKCLTTSGTSLKDKKIWTNSLKDELVLNAEAPVKGTKVLDLFKAVAGAFAVIKFEPEAGGECKFKETSVEGSVDVEILNSKKEVVAFEEHEAEEAVGFIKALANGTKECKIKAGVLDKCTTSSLKAFGVASTLEGTAKLTLALIISKGEKVFQDFGVFSK